MSGISDLARSFEEKSKQQASAIETSVANAYAQHEQTLLNALHASEESLSTAIQRREQKLGSLLDETERKTRAAVLNSWKWLLGSLAACSVAAGGALWWTGQAVTKNLAIIEQQKAMLARAQVLGIQFHQDANGQFIVLPRGMRTDGKPWTFDNGRRQAIKLEK
jgi:hypothetical protein